jgi:hypothetical protein
MRSEIIKWRLPLDLYKKLEALLHFRSINCSQNVMTVSLPKGFCQALVHNCQRLQNNHSGDRKDRCFWSIEDLAWKFFVDAKHYKLYANMGVQSGALGYYDYKFHEWRVQLVVLLFYSIQFNQQFYSILFLLLLSIKWNNEYGRLHQKRNGNGAWQLPYMPLQ